MKINADGVPTAVTENESTKQEQKQVKPTFPAIAPMAGLQAISQVANLKGRTQVFCQVPILMATDKTETAEAINLSKPPKIDDKETKALSQPRLQRVNRPPPLTFDGSTTHFQFPPNPSDNSINEILLDTASSDNNLERQIGYHDSVKPIIT